MLMTFPCLPGNTWVPDIFPSLNPGFAWLADCSNGSPICKEAPLGHFLSENGLE